MKRSILSLAAAAILAMPFGASAGVNTPLGCLAANGGGDYTAEGITVNGSTQRSCTVAAGLEAEAQSLADVVVFGGRVSWSGIGRYKVEMFASCRDQIPVRTWTASDFVEGNNGGGYFGYCLKATALSRGSAVAIGPLFLPAAP